MKVSPCFCLVMAVLLLLQQPVAALNWQGTGNLNNDNLTYVWAYIHTNFASKINSGEFDEFTQGLSTALNNQWDPAWNVVLTHSLSTSLLYNDVVLYAYSFRQHWMWFNGYIDPSVANKQFSFVIWKDYNCQDWQIVGQNGVASGFSTAQEDKIKGWISSLVTEQLIKNDPWTLAKSFMDTLQADADFVVADNHAYSIVFSQDFSSSSIFGRVCEVGINHYYSTPYGALQNDFGMILLLQTR